MNQLFFDIDSQPEFVVEENINEATGKTEKTYKVKGIFSTIGERNRNGRVYPKNLWENEVKKYQENFANGSINCLMEWEHPARTEVDPMRAVGKINSLKIEGKYVMGEAVLLNNPQANQLKSLIDNGVKISVSSRGTGNVHNGVVEEFNLITYDFVPNPSDYNATMNGMCESHQLNEGVVQDLYFTLDKYGNIVPSKQDVNESVKPVDVPKPVESVAMDDDENEDIKENAEDTQELYSSEDIAKAIERKFADALDEAINGTSKGNLANELSEKVQNGEIVIEDPYNYEIRYLVNNKGFINESNLAKVDFKKIARSLKENSEFTSLDNVKFIKMENYKVTEIK
jgi:hypothetical protein